MPVSRVRRFLQNSDLLQTAAILPSASVPHFVALCVIILATAAAPTAIIVLTGALVGLVQVALQRGLDTSDVGPMLAYGGGVVALYCAQQLLAPISYTFTNGLGNRLTVLWRELVMKATLDPEGVSHLEDPQVADRISAATGLENRAFAPVRLVEALAEMVSRRLYGLGAGLILASHNVWMAIALWISWSLIPGWIAANTRAQMRRAESLSPLLRRADYYRDLGLRQRPAKEIRIYGLAQWVVEEFTRHRSEGLASVSGDRGLARMAFVPYLAVPTAVSAFVIWSLVQEALGGSMDVARLTVLVLAVVGTKEFGRSAANWTRAFFGAGSVARARQVSCQTKESVQVVESVDSKPESLSCGRISIRGISFSYPGSSVPVFKNLDLDITGGRSLAIVGANGAGKTTLVKLLARLYDPDRGSISIDGIDLRKIDVRMWRSLLAVIFQDFVRYDLSVRENIGVGCLDLMSEEASLRNAASKAGAERLIDGLPWRWDTVLSRGYEKGTELSGGEWQRIALARAFAAVEGGARILVLDEPTANLDIKAEAELFDRFLELTQGLTTILISHRMSSVRHADRICVLRDGSVIEDGDHSHLLGLDGVYARMFRLQAMHVEKE